MTGEIKDTLHVPVLLNEILEGLSIRSGDWYIDATAGGGGHTAGILEKGGRVLAFDQDAQAVSYLQQKFAERIRNKQLMLVQANFRQIREIAHSHDIKKVSGIIFDLGMSTDQLKNSGRGFSFMRDEPLDMRMSETATMSAVDIINTYSQAELIELFIRFGEETLAENIAWAIVEERRKKAITTTNELSTIVSEVYKRNGKNQKNHPGTKIFQALRIAVNGELEALTIALDETEMLLGKKGRCLVISFHSLEDRIVKQFLLKHTKTLKMITKKPIHPGKTENKENRAARSARLRIFEKI